MNTRQRPNGKCWCGCGAPTASFFAPGHDRRTEAAIVKVVYGSLPDMLVKHGYGPDGMNLNEEAA